MKPIRPLARRPLATLLLLLVPLAAACTTVPAVDVPDPLPEALSWEPPADGGPFLGILGEENDSGSLEDLFFRPGVRVVRVVLNSPAARAGVQAGDVVLALEGRQVDDPGALDAAVELHAAGESVELSVQRGDTVFAVPVTLAERDGGAAAAPARPQWRVDPLRSRAGWLTAEGGVRLVTADPRSPFPRAGVPVGSVVLALQGEPVLSDRELVRRLQAHEPGARVRVSVRRPGEQQPDEATVRLLDVPRRVTGWNLLFLADYDAAPDGSRAAFSLLDLWFFELLQYEREGKERRWVLFELFGFDLLSFSSGLGELSG